MSTRTKDLRQDQRVTFSTSLTLDLADGALPASLRNLSLAGICCTTHRPFQEMTEVEILLDLPPTEESGEAPRLRLRGAVVRCEPLRRGAARKRFELGIYFLELPARDKELLMSFIRSRQTD